MTATHSETDLASLESLDFAIPCSGRRGTDIIVCDNPAHYLLINGCGCESFKCQSCFDNWITRRNMLLDQGWDTAKCMNCSKLRLLLDTIIRLI
jgi:hypothetical protein